MKAPHLMRGVIRGHQRSSEVIRGQDEGSPPDEGGNQTSSGWGGGGVIKRLRFELPRRFPTVRAAMELDQLGVAQHVERIVEEDALACLGVAEEALKVRVHQRRQGGLGHAATKHCACMQ